MENWSAHASFFSSLGLGLPTREAGGPAEQTAQAVSLREVIVWNIIAWAVGGWPSLFASAARVCGAQVGEVVLQPPKPTNCGLPLLHVDKAKGTG